MTKKETYEFLRKMDSAIPSWNPKDLQATLDIWAECMEDVRYDYANKALKEYLMDDTSGFAPTIGIIRQKVSEYRKQENESGLRYWMNRVRSIYPYEFKCTQIIEECDAEKFYWYVVKLVRAVEAGMRSEEEINTLDKVITMFKEQ